MRLHKLQADEIHVASDRQRKEFSTEELIKLASSISQNGLIHPLVVRKNGDEYVLVAGERRLRALHYIWDFEDSIRCGEYQFAKGEVPCLYVGELDEIMAYEMELEENIRRVDLTWQEKAEATAKLMAHRRKQAELAGEAPPTVEDIAVEVRGGSSRSRETTREELAVVAHLGDEEIAGAKSVGDAFKLLKRKEEKARNVEIAKAIGVTYSSSVHDLRHGDCFEIMADFPKETFDVIVTDPPYGINADEFNDSGGIATGNHFYDDSWTTWNLLSKRLATESFRICKPQSHIYIFCDVDNFVLLKSYMTEANWNVFRTPLLWVNQNGARAPWPEHGPQRKYQCILYAEKGRKKVNYLASDVITTMADPNLGHQAQKPVAIYYELLKRSCAPGNKVLDPFGGTGPIIRAAHMMKCYATYIEQDEASFGIAVGRLKELDR